MPSASNAGQTTITLERIGALLVKEHHVGARYTEVHYSGLLTEPLRSAGTLDFTPPSRIEKHTLSPDDELFIADGDKIFIVDKVKNFTKTLSVDDHPALRAFVEAFRAMLGGRIDLLQKHFSVTVQGTEDAWFVTASPRNPDMLKLISEVKFAGHGPAVRNIDILEASGDRSALSIEEQR